MNMYLFPAGKFSLPFFSSTLSCTHRSNENTASVLFASKRSNIGKKMRIASFSLFLFNYWNKDAVT